MADAVDIKHIDQQWKVLDTEYQTLEEGHKNYNNSIVEFTKLQNKCLKDITHQNYRISQLKQLIQKCVTNGEEEERLKEDLLKQMGSRRA
ncbi:unnamed protein product, partial [Medioppia subpectinata]